MPAVAADHLTAVGACLFQRSHHVAVGGLVDQRPDQRAGGRRVADRQLPVGGHDPLDDVVGHRAVHDQPAQAGAALAGGAGGGEHDGAHRQVQVGRRRDDGRVVAAQFQQHPAEPPGHPWADLLAHPHRAGRGQQRDPRIVDQPLAEVAAAHEAGR